MSRHENKNGSAFGKGFIVGGEFTNCRKPVSGEHTQSHLNLRFNASECVDPPRSARAQQPDNKNNKSSKHVLMNPTNESINKLREAKKWNPVTKLDPPSSIRIITKAKNSDGLSRCVTHKHLEDALKNEPLTKKNAKQAREHAFEHGSKQERFAAMRNSSSIFDLPKHKPDKRRAV